MTVKVRDTPIKLNWSLDIGGKLIIKAAKTLHAEDSMQSQKLTREQREQQLRGMLQTPHGNEEVQRLFMALFPMGVMPPIGSLMIQTILDHEYNPESGSAGEGPAAPGTLGLPK